MGVIIEESGLRFGEYHENQVFQIETSEQYTKSLRQNGIKTCEFILRKGTKLYFFEAKQSCPRQIMKDIPDNEKEEKKKEKIIRKLESGKLQLSVHVITLAISEKNQLEIYPTLQFKQPAFPEQDLFVVGITKGYEEAVELVEQIVQEVYEQTGGCDIRSYILEKEQGR